MPSAMQSSYCASLVRAHDHDRYLCALAVPPDIREAWFALFAFNHEIASIAEIVSEQMIGIIRFAWWREALDEIYAGKPVRKHPVAEALAEVIRAYHLPRAPFDTLLEARAQDLEPEPFGSDEALEHYCRDSSSSLLELCAAAAKLGCTPELSELGIAWALIGICRKGHYASDAELIALAERHLKLARIPRTSPFAPFLIAAEWYLTRLKRGAKRKSHVALPLKLWWKACLTE